MHIFTELNNGLIGNSLDRYKKMLENIRVIPDTTLFPVEWNTKQKDLLYNKKRCPECGNKLLFVPHEKPVKALCRGKRHGDRKPFIISLGKLSGNIKVHG